MGDPADQPPLPEFEFAPGPAGADVHVQAVAGVQLAAGAGGRHRLQPRVLAALGRTEERPAVQGLEGQRVQPQRHASRSSRSRTADGGLFVGARRNAEEGQYYWRITPWVMPTFTMVPPRGDHPVHGHFWVPIDDENCWVFTFDYLPGAGADRDRAAGDEGRPRGAQREHPRDLPAAGQQGQRLPDGPRRRRSAARRSPASRASRSRTRRCRRAWARSWTAPRSGWSPPTAGSSRPGEAAAGGAGAARGRHGAARGRPGPPPRPLGRRSCCPRSESFLDAARDAVSVIPGVPQTSV